MITLSAPGRRLRARRVGGANPGRRLRLRERRLGERGLRERPRELAEPRLTEPRLVRVRVRVRVRMRVRVRVRVRARLGVGEGLKPAWLKSCRSSSHPACPLFSPQSEWEAGWEGRSSAGSTGLVPE